MRPVNVAQCRGRSLRADRHVEARKGQFGVASAAQATGVRDDGLARPAWRVNAFMQLSPGAHAAGM